MTPVGPRPASCLARGRPPAARPRHRGRPPGPARRPTTSRPTPTATASPTAGTTSATPSSSIGAAPSARSASGSRTPSPAGRRGPAGPSASTAARPRRSSSASGSGRGHPGRRAAGRGPGPLIDFLGDQLAVDRPGLLGPWTSAVGTGWIRVAKRIAVPRGTRDAIMSVGLLGATGTLEIDGLTIDLVPVGGAETTNLVLNGDFELGDPAPTFWIVEDGAQRAFPGHRSAVGPRAGGLGVEGADRAGRAGPTACRTLEVSLAAKGAGLQRGAGGAGGGLLPRRRRPALPGPTTAPSLFRWAGTFDWQDERATVHVPPRPSARSSSSRSSTRAARSGSTTWS